MIRRSIIPRILIPALLIAAAVFSLLGRIVLAQTPTHMDVLVRRAQDAQEPPTILLRDDVAVQSCGATWTTDRRWIACGTVFKNSFDP